MGKKSKVLNQISVRYHVVRVFFVIFISWVFMSQISWLVFFCNHVYMPSKHEWYIQVKLLYYFMISLVKLLDSGYFHMNVMHVSLTSLSFLVISFLPGH